MALINTIRKQVDLPTWETLRMAPAVSSATSGTCYPDNGAIHTDFGRYIYYLISATQFMRYDTISDTYMGLASPPITQTLCSKLYFNGAAGFEGRVLSSTATTFTAPAFIGKRAKSYDVRIISGTGQGQQRYISDVSDPIVADTGVVTAATALVITDSTKAWVINQWAGYQLRITFGSGVSQVRRILNNDATSLTFVDVNRCAVEYNANPQAPSPGFSATAGVQSMYQIESSTMTVDAAWAINPDTTSKFRIMSGTITVLTGTAALPFYAIQIYDILSDTWYIRTAPTPTLLGVAATDFVLQRTTENASIWTKGIATGGSTLTLADSAQNWSVNSLSGDWMRIYSGSGENQLRQITSNTSTVLTLSGTGTAPDTTSRYIVSGFTAGIAVSGNTQILIDTNKNWSTNRWKNYVLRITSGTGKGLISPILSNTSNAITLIEPSTFIFDNTSQYEIQGDTQSLYIGAGTQSAIMLHYLDADMTSFGRLNDYGCARGGSAQFGNFPAIPVTSTSGTTLQTVTTTIPHGFQTGWVIKHMGDNSASSLTNNITAVVAVSSATTYTYATPGSTTAWTISAQSSLSLTDATKTWIVNEHANKVCYFLTAAPAIAAGVTAMSAMEISSNTPNTLIFKSPTTAPTTGVSRYIIANRSGIGSIASGIATGTQSGTTLQDTTQVGSFIGSTSTYTMNITSVSSGSMAIGAAITGTGITAGTTVTGFISGTLGGIGLYTINTPVSAGPTAITSGWVVNAYAGRRLRTVSGSGQGTELTILSNTNNTITWSTAGTAPSAISTSYNILGGSIKGAGLGGCWTYGTTDTNKAGKFIILSRGGAVLGFDKLDITTDLFELMTTSPQSETLTTGSMYAYDGINRLYFTKESTLRNYYLDLDTYQIHGAGLTPYITGTATLGDRMEIFTTVPDGLKYLWTQRHTATDVFRQLIIY